MREGTEFTIRIISATIKCICGWMLLDKVVETNSLLFVISGILLLIAGLSCIVPYIFDKIELYIMNKRDTDCNVIKDVETRLDK